MATSTNLGRVGFVPKGTYSSTASYKRLDVVSSSDGNTYVAIADSTGAAQTDTTKWKVIIDNSVILEPKVDKVPTATENNFATFNAAGGIKDSGKKASDFASASEVTAARGEFENLNARLDNIEDAALTHRYGILWDKTNATCTRLYDAVGLTANAHKGSYNASQVNDFDSLYPWSGRKLCNIDIAEYKRIHETGGDIDGAISAWEGDPDFSYTGANGAVMVYTPEFWMKTAEVDGGVEVVVADKFLPGYQHVPRYIGGRYHGSDDGNGGLTSVAGAAMLSDSVSLETLHSRAKANGMTLEDIWTWTADTVLCAVEFATLDSQSAIGSGVSSLYRASSEHPYVAETGATRVIAPVAFANVAIVGAILAFGTSNDRGTTARRIITSITDYTDSNYKIINFSGGTVDVTTSLFISIHGLSNLPDAEIGSSSGYIGTNGKANAYYRGRVAHANAFRYVLGAYRQTGTGNIWIAHDREEADAYDGLDTSVHIDTGFTLPYDSSGTNQQGYINELYFHDKFPLFMFVKSVGGSSSNPVGDYLWHPASTTVDTILQAGGNASGGAGCGRLSGAWSGTSGGAWWIRAALPFLK